MWNLKRGIALKVIVTALLRVHPKRVLIFREVCLELRICNELYCNSSNINLGVQACGFGTKLFTTLVTQEPILARLYAPSISLYCGL
jgi:hypothetical protein